MRGYKPKRNRQGELTNLSFKVLGSIFLLLLVGLSIHSTWDMYGKFVEASNGKKAAQVQLATLELQQEKVTEDVAQINSSRGTETALRERYGVAKPGEGEIRIVPKQGDEASSSVKQIHSWSQFWNALTGH